LTVEGRRPDAQMNLGQWDTVHDARTKETQNNGKPSKWDI